MLLYTLNIMIYKELDKPEYRHEEIWRHQHPLEGIVQLIGGFKLVRKVEELGERVFKEKYRVFDVDNEILSVRWSHLKFYHGDLSEEQKKQKREDFLNFTNSYDLLPGGQWGLFISIPLLKDLVNDYIPKSVIEYENYWRNINPSNNMGLSYFSSDDKNEVYVVTKEMKESECQNLKSLANSVLDIDSEDKMKILFDSEEKGKKWRKNAKIYCVSLLDLIKNNDLGGKENLNEKEIKGYLEYHTDEREDEKTVRKIYFDSISLMKDLCDFYLEKMDLKN